jgi:hypothetical protein
MRIGFSDGDEINLDTDSGVASILETDSETEPDPDLVAALERARGQEPWTVQLVREHANEPAERKAAASLCTQCRKPCERSEVCATLVAHEGNLLDNVGREQAFQLVESGMQRLQIEDEAVIRTDDRERPNRFIELTQEEE